LQHTAIGEEYATHGFMNRHEKLTL